MKKLGKLSINVDKIIKNEELVNLRGGTYFEIGSLACWDWNHVLVGPIIISSGCTGDADNDLGICNYVYAPKRTQDAVCIHY